MSMELQTHGTKKYPGSGLLTSSAGLGWSGLAADLRAHPAGETPVVVPRTVELCITVTGNDDGLVIRTGAGQRQETRAVSGAIGLSPIDVGDNQLIITAPIPKALHLYLPTTQFRKLADDFNLPAAPAHSIRYVGGIRDEFIFQTGLSIISEMENESAAGRMLVETASTMLAAHLLHSYYDGGVHTSRQPTTQGLGPVKLRRVLDYISQNLEEELTLDQLAQVAGLSVFHFARTFTRATGVSPGRYVNRMRLEQAMADIAVDKLSLAEIAFKAGFSSQASFTRAFHRATGLTPGDYRAQRR